MNGGTGEAPPARPTVLVTRPRAQAVATARLLHRAGYRALIDPLLAVQAIPYQAPSADGVAAILLTSANGVLGYSPRLAGVPVLAVGRATAAAARRRGWTSVESADGDAAALARLAGDAIDPAAGVLLHLAGEEVRPGLGEALAASGHEYRRVIVYRAEAAANLAPRTRRALAAEALDAVLLYSPRTALVFADLVAAAGVAHGLRRAAGLCLSAEVAARVRTLPWREILVADRRSQDALLARLGDLTAAA